MKATFELTKEQLDSITKEITEQLSTTKAKQIEALQKKYNEDVKAIEDKFNKELSRAISKNKTFTINVDVDKTDKKELTEDFLITELNNGTKVADIIKATGASYVRINKMKVSLIEKGLYKKIEKK